MSNKGAGRSMSTRKRYSICRGRVPEPPQEVQKRQVRYIIRHIRTYGSSGGGRDDGELLMTRAWAREPERAREFRGSKFHFDREINAN